MRVTGGACSFSEWHKCIQWGVAVRFSVTEGRVRQLGVRTLRLSSLLRLQHQYVPSASLCHSASVSPSVKWGTIALHLTACWEAG